MKLFTEVDREAIRKAVQTAEGETSGEIVPFIVGRSDGYAEAMWRGAAAAGALCLAIAVLLPPIIPAWGLGWLYSPAAVALAGLVGAFLGALIVRNWPAALRALAGETTLAERVHGRALEAFVEEEVFNTRERTGILLFVSLLERRIEVVGDSGINAHVEPDDWAETVHLVREGLVSGRAAEGLIAAIRHCGDLLRDKGVEIRPDDTNELSDRLRIEDE